MMGEDHKSISRSDKAWELPLQMPGRKREHELMFPSVLWGQLVNPGRPFCPLISVEETALFWVFAKVLTSNRCLSRYFSCSPTM